MNKSKKQATIALKKAQTNITNIIKMIEEDKYCMEVIQQILAINGLLKSASNKILEEHLNTCFREGIKTNDKNQKNKLIQEVVDVITLGNRNK